MSSGKIVLKDPLFQPEISARRISGLMKFHIEERGIEDPYAFSGVLTLEERERILKDSGLWISQKLEERILNFLSASKDIVPAIYQLGNEIFLSSTYDLLPLDYSQITICECIQRIPLLISRLTRCIRFDLSSLDEHSASFLITHEKGFYEKWYDILFFKGMLDGLPVLFELTGFKASLKSTRLFGIHVLHRDLGENIQFGAEETIYSIQWENSFSSLGKTPLDVNEIPKAERTFLISRVSEDLKEDYSVIHLSSVIKKSRDLALENRDLEAAVEVLKSFKTELEIKQKSIAKDLKLAKNIQQGLIPQSIPDWNGIQFWFYFRPMQEVSGDYFDYFPFSEDRLGIALCDVSGHGVPAAFITALSKMLFTNYKSIVPSNIFKKVNRELLELIQYQGYTTCIYSVIDKNYNVTYSVAGHPRPIYYDSSLRKAFFLDGEGTFLGMFPEANDYYEDYKVQMKPGDKIFLYTDGITEALNEEGVPYGEERLLTVIENSSELSIRDSIESIVRDFTQFIMGTDQADDVTILGWCLSPYLREFETLTSQGIYSYRQREYTQASKCFLRAKEIMPRELSNILYLAKSFAKMGKFNEAIDQLLEYNQYKKNNYESHYVLGYCYFMVNELEKAEIELKKAIYLDDSYPLVYHNLLRVYARLSRWDKYREYLQKMKRNFPEYPRFKELESILKRETE